MTTTIFILVHANRSFGELVAIMQLTGVLTLIDVRQHPQSAWHPHFAQETLRAALAGVGI